MTTPLRPAVRLGALAALALAAPLALGGCSAIGDALGDAVSGAVEGGIKGATGADVDLGGAEIPEGFPSKVPLLDGEVSYGGSVGSGDDTAWTVVMTVDTTDAYEEAAGELEADGWETSFEGAADGGATGAFSKGKLGVVITVAPNDEGGSTVTYVVTRSSDN